jgi:hypothetical protein
MRGPREGIMGLRSSWMVVASPPLGHNFDSGRPECAITGRPLMAWRTDEFDPELPFPVSPIRLRKCEPEEDFAFLCNCANRSDLIQPSFTSSLLTRGSRQSRR